MHVLARRSLVFRIWLALSLIATAFTTAVLGAFVWLSVEDIVDSAHDQTTSKVGVVLATASRFGFNGPSPTTGELSIAGSLGIEFVQSVAADGTVLTGFDFGSKNLEDTPLDPAGLALASRGEISYRTVQIGEAGFEPASVKPDRILRGGEFGEEHVIPLTLLFPSAQQGALRVLITYPDVTAESRTLLLRSLAAGFIIVLTTLAGIGLFLRHFVSRPLRRYSQLAGRIAQGERLRMPADGDDELGELGRAVNGMADSLEYQATVDALTGLYNLRHLSSTLERLISEASESAQPLSLIVGDLDNLKPVNDTFGHQAGDQVLQAVAASIRAWTGEDSYCWRLGGDEFVVALPNTDEAQAQAQQLKRRIGMETVRVGEADISPSISVGVSSYPKDGNSAGALLNAADGTMYEAKASRAVARRLAKSRAA